MKYLIDSNCFIEPHRGVCPMDVATSFWNKMKELTRERDVYILDRVKGELTEWDNDLKDWVVANVGKQQLVKFENDATVQKFREVNVWTIGNNQYSGRKRKVYGCNACGHLSCVVCGHCSK